MDLYRVYEKLPSFLQHCAVSMKGWTIRRSRYGPAFRQYARRAVATQWRTRREWRRLQARKLGRIVEYARDHVPYYREALQNVDLAPVRDAENIDIGAVLEQIPVTDKEPIREHPERYRSDEIGSMETVSFRTSGTTGTPLRVLQSLDANQMLHAAKERFWRSAGVRYGDRRLSFTGNYVVPLRSDSGPFGRMDIPNRRRLMSVFHLAEPHMQAYLDEIRRFDPAFIDGYPSAMEVCARAALEMGLNLEVPAAFPTAETLSAEQRDVIEEGFGTRVYNHYGSTEGAALITECPAGNMHVHPEIGIVELVQTDDDLEAREIVVTSLNNRAMPFIRFRIGDMAIPRDQGMRCSCGREMPMIADIVGRRDDLVLTPDGRRMMLSYNLLKWAEHVQEAQIVQTEITEFELRIVPDPEFTREDQQLLVGRLRERIGQQATIDVDIVEDIERTGRGKFRSVISHVDPAE